jgi:phosphatidylglycerophosphate synthase
LLPALLVTAYFLGGYVLFVVRCAVWGTPRDPEMEARGGSILVGPHLRNGFVWVTQPIWRLVVASGASPTTITGIAAALGGAAGVAVAFGRFALGGWMFLFSGILDAMDGRLARARGQVTKAGGLIDSVLDRYVDGAMLVGLGWYYRGTWVLPVALVALVGSQRVPYVRARSEALGVPVRTGVMQRAERLLFLGTAVALKMCRRMPS